jgi:uncharacterized membrane protein YheB (UPF0754 family)
MTQEFLERTDVAGNIIYTTKTGETVKNDNQKENVVKNNNHFVATVALDTEAIMNHLCDSDRFYTAVSATMFEASNQQSMQKVMEDFIAEKAEEVVNFVVDSDYIQNSIDSTFIESVVDEDYIRFNGDYLKQDIISDLASELEDAVGEANKRLLDSYNVDTPCDIGIVFRKAVIDTIHWFMDTEGKHISRTINVKDSTRVYTLEEIQQIMTNMGYSYMWERIKAEFERTN